MTAESFDSADVEAIASVLQEFQRRCAEVTEALGQGSTVSKYQRELATSLYVRLKADVKEAAKYGTLSGRREPLTRAEQCFYDPAVRRAAIALRPATNSHPISSNWRGALWEATSEFSYWLHNMEKATA